VIKNGKEKERKEFNHFWSKEATLRHNIYPSRFNPRTLSKEGKIEAPYLDVVKRKSREYILNCIAWANEQRKKGNPYARFPSEAVCVNNLRLEIKRWIEEGYPEVTDTTRYLLNFWFEQPRDKVFWFSQREAIETLIYLYEVKGITKVSEFLNEYGAFKLSGYEEYDKYPRYVFRMATG